MSSTAYWLCDLVQITESLCAAVSSTVMQLFYELYKLIQEKHLECLLVSM